AREAAAGPRGGRGPRAADPEPLASVLRQPEHDQRISIRITDLEVPAGGDGDEFLAVQFESHRRRVDSRPGLELPELIPGLGVERIEVPVAFAGEHEPARGDER